MALRIQEFISSFGPLQTIYFQTWKMHVTPALQQIPRTQLLQQLQEEECLTHDGLRPWECCYYQHNSTTTMLSFGVRQQSERSWGMPPTCWLSPTPLLHRVHSSFESQFSSAAVNAAETVRCFCTVRKLDADPVLEQELPRWDHSCIQG